MKKSVFAVVAFASAALAQPAFAEWFDPHFEVSVDFCSAYLSRGRINEDRPILVQDFRGDVGLGDYGRLGVWYGTYSSLTDRRSDDHRHAFPESDIGLYYDYDVKLAEGWKLANEVMVDWMMYFGEKPEDGPTDYEWRFSQTLKNPYVTPYWKYRHGFKPNNWSYFAVGVKKPFEINERFSISPFFWVDFGDGRLTSMRYGYKRGENHAGPMMVNGGLRGDWKLNDNVSFYALLSHHDVVGDKNRAGSHGMHRRDTLYFQCGVSFSF